MVISSARDLTLVVVLPSPVRIDHRSRLWSCGCATILGSPSRASPEVSRLRMQYPRKGNYILDIP